MHLVHKASIELNTGSYSEPGALRHWVQHTLLEQLDEVLTAEADDDLWVQADKLELNLVLPDLESADTGSIKDQLQTQVRLWLRTVHGDKAHNVVKPLAHRMDEVWRDYLEGGTLPSPRAALQLTNWLKQQAESNAIPQDETIKHWLKVLQQPATFERAWTFLHKAGAWHWAMLAVLPNATHQQLVFPQTWIELAAKLDATAQKLFWHTLLQQAIQPVPLQWQALVTALPQSIQAILDNQHAKFASLQQAAAQAKHPIETPTETPNDHIPNQQDEPLVAKPVSVQAGIKESLEVENAGLVLLAAFLPAFFENIYKETWQQQPMPASNGPALLHYLATGQTEAEEWQLALPKLLCGIPLSENCDTAVLASDRLTAESNNLLQSVIEHWGKLGSTSPDGLRANFLQRTGMLLLMTDHYELRIEEQAADILLNYLPWNYKLIRLPWMQQMLFVLWA